MKLFTIIIGFLFFTTSYAESIDKEWYVMCENDVDFTVEAPDWSSANSKGEEICVLNYGALLDYVKLMSSM